MVSPNPNANTEWWESNTDGEDLRSKGERQREPDKKIEREKKKEEDEVGFLVLNRVSIPLD